MERERKPAKGGAGGSGGRGSRPAAPRQEYEVAWYTKEMGRPLQREMLRERLAALKEVGDRRAAHGEDAGAAPSGPDAWDDRAG